MRESHLYPILFMWIGHSCHSTASRGKEHEPARSGIDYARSRETQIWERKGRKERKGEESVSSLMYFSSFSFSHYLNQKTKEDKENNECFSSSQVTFKKELPYSSLLSKILSVCLYTSESLQKQKSNQFLRSQIAGQCISSSYSLKVTLTWGLPGRARPGSGELSPWRLRLWHAGLSQLLNFPLYPI
jgi:hypothetical protein